MSDQILSVITGVIIVLYSCTGTVKCKIKEKINEQNNYLKTKETYSTGLKSKHQEIIELVRKYRESSPSDDRIPELYNQITKCLDYLNHEIKINNRQRINIKTNGNLLKRDANNTHKLLSLLSLNPLKTDGRIIEMELNELYFKPSKTSVHLKKEGQYLVPVTNEYNSIYCDPIIEGKEKKKKKKKNKIKPNIQGDSEYAELKATSNKCPLTLSSVKQEIHQNNSEAKNIEKLESQIQVENDKNHSLNISVNHATNDKDGCTKPCGKLSSIMNGAKINMFQKKQNITEPPIKQEQSKSEFSHKYLNTSKIDIPIDNDIELTLLNVLNNRNTKATTKNNINELFSDSKDSQDFMYYLDQINQLNLLEDKLNCKQATTRKIDSASVSPQLPDNKIIDTFF